jgi:succinate-semialdehyde dehydrogenase / glutarate-semialdehyde dehydrogenase
MAIEEVFTRAGYPEGVFQSLLIEVEQVPAILDDPRVQAVTLTGSDRAGRDVASRAGRALKKSVLELGGSDPFIVTAKADLTQAVATAVKSRLFNSGQSCIAAKRFIVIESVAEEFLRRFTEAMGSVKIGDPLDPSTELGPLARADLVEMLTAQVNDAVAHGARLLTGGAPIDRPGCYYPATVLADVPESARAYREELFGPVATVFRVKDLDEAIALANDTQFGLAASIYTSDIKRALRGARAIRAGTVTVNSYGEGDSTTPFGGFGLSGFGGRDKGTEAHDQYTRIKTIWVDLSDDADQAV